MPVTFRLPVKPALPQPLPNASAVPVQSQPIPPAVVAPVVAKKLVLKVQKAPDKPVLPPVELAPHEPMVADVNPSKAIECAHCGHWYRFPCSEDADIMDCPNFKHKQKEASHG